MEAENILVSIIVITYNSSQFVLETLESTKAQTYQNIELIISDDGSTDDTVAICLQWIESNQERFARTEVITVHENTGIPANCNRGAKAAKGYWVKLIAGDDALMNDCIRLNMEHIKENTHIDILFSKSAQYRKNFDEINFIHFFPAETNQRFYSTDSTAKEQFNILLRNNKVNAPTVFIKKEVLSSQNYFDETYKLIEDYPTWLKLTKNGYKFHFSDKVTVKHRFHEDATDSNILNTLYQPNYFTFEKIKLEITKSELPSSIYYQKKYSIYIQLILNYLGLNTKTAFVIFIDRVFTSFLNPFKIYNKILKIT